MVADHDVRRRALEPEHAQLDAQALGEGPRRHPRRVEGLHEGERPLHRLHRPRPHRRHVLERHPQQAVLVEVLDDRLADLEGDLVGLRHPQLPQQVVVEVGRLGERVLDRRDLGQLGRPHAALPAVVEVVLEEALDLDLLERVLGALALGRGSAWASCAISSLVFVSSTGTSSRRGFSITSCSRTSASSSVVRGRSLIACWSEGVRMSLCESRAERPSFWCSAKGLGSAPAGPVRPRCRRGGSPPRGRRVAPRGPRRALWECRSGRHHRPSEYRRDP